MKYDFDAVAVVLKQSMELIHSMREKCSNNVGGTDWHLKHDGSLVTEIDPANEAFLREKLTDNGEYFLGEESLDAKGDKDVRRLKEYVEAALKGRTWVVDPIDGTAPFAHHLPLWGISLGYMEGGILRDGAIALPDLGQCFLTKGDRVMMATNITAPVEEWKWHVLPQPADGWDPGRMITLGQRFTRYNTIPFKNPLLTPGSAVHSLSCLLTGNAIAYIGHVKLWDIAGVLPMLCRLGFQQQLLNGAFMTENVTADQVFVLDVASEYCWVLKDTFISARPNVLSYVRSKL